MVDSTPPAHEVPAMPSGLKVGKPNYIIFMPDQLRYDSLGCSGNKYVKTPNIDKFAAEGTRFTNCFVQASVCAQSRCSIFTGNYSHVAGHRSLENLIKPWEPNLFRSLKERGGYHVACLAPRGDMFAPTVTELSVDEYGFLETPEFTSRWGSFKDDDGNKEDIFKRLFYRGLRDAKEAEDYDDAVVRSALKWLEKPPEGPWLLFMPLMFPHLPFMVEEPYFSMYDRSEMPPPSSPEDKTGHEPQYMKIIREKYGTSRATPEIWAEIKATYYGMISRLDDQFGKLMEKTKALGHWDNTITMFFTDHGEYLGDHGLVEKWPSGVSDSLTHEPLIVGGCGLPSGVVYEGMAEMVDLMPTLFQFSGIPEHFPHCGRSMAELLTSAARSGGHGDDESSVEHKKYAFSEGGFLSSEEPLLERAGYPYDIKAALQHDDTEVVGRAVACRDRKWTYIYRLYEPPELYDRERDVGELHNLAEEAEYVEVRRKMEAVILRWMMSTSDFVPWKKDPRFPEVLAGKTPKEQWEARTAR
ncbi:hypothetical protein D7B24_001908 [Verticillium nonalfalfae]|uniref:Sulfatase N-terminal domain-containing protein n=1 Tax=Verticillium nonalfalfae TaxID=1051616 RepID=A0A3M9Y2Q6_9PEZI|nr:uncharacterized protein D7B24_001908 [Verticillium nonalfalfae]RNJ53430.1 hypothetical protein D7B24_001908 [Verticillium nonalfalfae]